MASIENVIQPLVRLLGIRLGSRFWVNETSQISERYSDQMQAIMKQRICPMFGQMHLSMIEYPKHDWHAAFGHKRLCCRRATAGTFILNLLYKVILIKICFLWVHGSVLYLRIE